jgi:hypothetical protein
LQTTYTAQGTDINVDQPPPHRSAGQ